MFDLSRIGRAIGLTVGAAAAVAGVGAVAALRRPLPRMTGRQGLPGLAGDVEVRRDRWGVPHVYAGNNHDLFAAVGYVHAQDRLWQMELNRRTGHGTLAEIFGPIALSSDTFVRTLGFSRVVQRELDLLDDETAGIIDAYCRGINAFLQASRNRLPLEFTILGFEPALWTPLDVLIWPKVMALNLSGNWMSELLNARIVARLGAERATTIAPRYPDEAPPTVPPGLEYPPGLGDAVLQLAAEAARFTGQSESAQGSNAWVVAASRSSTGHPLLANDPHLGLALPGIWYEMHLEGGDFHVAGGTMPGTVSVIIGHNRRIAWGVTNAMTDNQDLFVERFHPEDRLRYEYRGEWLPAELHREEIQVKGQQDPTVIEVRTTRHGPVIDDAAGMIGVPGMESDDHKGAFGLAMRWTALDPSPVLYRAALAMDRATDIDSFRAALVDWDVPPQNFVYADVDGNIGYFLAGRLPIRAQGNGQLPVPGWTGAYEWVGFIDPAHLPATINPPGGAVVTANHRIAPPDYPLHDVLHGEWLNPYRAQRISSMIDALPQHDVRSFARIQFDVHSLPGKQLAALTADLALEDPLEIKARDALTAWDGDLTATSIAGTIYHVLRHQLLDEVYCELEELLTAAAGLGAFALLPGNMYLERSLPLVMARMSAVADRNQPDPWLNDRDWNTVLRAALKAAVAELREQFGADVKRWKYGSIHSLTLRHPLGNVPVLTPIFNRGPWPTGGDLDTVNQQYVPRRTAAGPLYNAASIRHIIDLRDWDASRSILPAGQSGHPASKHYSDMAEPWRTGAYHPMLWTREAVERHTASVMTLEPEGKA